MRRFISVWFAAALCLLCAACGRTEPAPLPEEDAVSEAPALTRSLPVAEALQRGAVQSILVIGDSISDGNTDDGCVWGQDEREALGCRLILTDENGNRYYENAPDSQGWVKFLRAKAEAAGASVFHNDAIGGMSAKWFNAHKEQLFTDDHPRYDAIFVMLGTNDRRDCLNEKEFYTEYSQLLSYLQEKCTYLTVMTPLPTFPEENSTKNMENRQIADTVLQLCENNGYTCLNLYRGMIDYVRNEGRALDEYFYAGCHPNSGGYLALWRLIADELGLNLPVEDVYARDEVLPQVIDIGMDRPEITEQTNLADTYQGAPVFPEGVSLYAVSQPFKSDISFGGTIVTRKYSNGAGYQIFKPFYLSYNFIRRANVDGVFGPWSVTNREQYSGEDW